MIRKSLPYLPSLQTIINRMPLVFPDGIEHRNYLIREMAAKTVFVMLYVGAIEGTNRWLRPDQVTKMTDLQAAGTSEKARLLWAQESLIPGKMKDVAGRWYAPNTREPIRDETLRYGLVLTGAVIERSGLPTTSAKPRYALNRGFAELFDERLSEETTLRKIRSWQMKHLSQGALARIQILKQGIVDAGQKGILVSFPNRETRMLAAGPSSVISKDVIEVFAPAFLQRPGVIFLSESGNKVVARDDKLARSIGLEIKADRNLPDIILVDIGPKNPLLVFIEVVATDGAITQSRKVALLDIAYQAGFNSKHVAFVSAFLDRRTGAYRKLASELAWGSFAWFRSEPDMIIILRQSGEKKAKHLFELA
ncbi:MAG: restriction endonuclease [Desulfobacteraceae bacterium]|nr:MAG: restriction endonuclease [Desulfobacteraceae bacterium]